MISVTRNEGSGSVKVSAPRLASRKMAVVALVIGVLVFASFAAYQQQQIGSLNRTIASQQVGTVVIDGTRYSYLDIPLQSLNLPASIQFNGVTFNFTGAPFGGTVYFTAVSVAQQKGNQTGQPVTVRIFPLGGSVQVKFADGQQESYSIASTWKNQTGPGVVYINLQPMNNPWFTQHRNPQAGVYWNSAPGYVELLVSGGT